MTDFAETLRHCCRYSRCRSKLPMPVSNHREAFCCRGCHAAFYRGRCIICEEAMERKTERQLICGERKCRNALKARCGLGRYLPSSNGFSSSKKPVNPGEKQAPSPDRPCHIVAGPKLTAEELHCATAPDGPDCRRKGGKYQRIEARNLELRKHFCEQAAQYLIQPHHPPVNIIGGYKFPNAPTVDLNLVEAKPVSALLHTPPDDDSLDIPQFLRRASLIAPGRK